MTVLHLGMNFLGIYIAAIVMELANMFFSDVCSKLLFALATMVLVVAPSVRGLAYEQVIYRFAGGNDGAGPKDLIVDQTGNLYGTTYDGGGPAGAGTGVQLSPPPQQGAMWRETILHRFSYSRLESGIGPKAGLVMDSVGNLFGSTWLGGPTGGGLVFELSPPAEDGEAWSYQFIYDFSAPNDGSSPEARLAL